MASILGPGPGPDALPYAVGFDVVYCGKIVPNSKRRIRWRFGFASPSGGAWRRGNEHEVTLVWSVYSGKALILFDGEEEKFKYDAGAGTEHSWKVGSRTLRVTAQLGNNNWKNPNLRQYNFFVDEKSFFGFPDVRGAVLSAGVPATAVPAGKQPEVLAPRGLSKADRALKQESKRNLMAVQEPPALERAPTRRLSVQASQLLIDFFDDFESTGNTHPPPQADDPWAQFTAAPVPVSPTMPFEQPAAATPAVPTVDFFSAAAPAQGPAAPVSPTNPFQQPAAPAQAVPTGDFFSAPAQGRAAAADPWAALQPVPPPTGAPPPPPAAAHNPFAGGNFAPGDAQGAMVTAAGQGGNWGLQGGQGPGQGQPPPYTMAGGYGQGPHQGQGGGYGPSPTQQNQWGAPSS